MEEKSLSQKDETDNQKFDSIIHEERSVQMQHDNSEDHLFQNENLNNHLEVQELLSSNNGP